MEDLMLDSKFRIPLVGKWARGIWECPHCGYTLSSPSDVYRNMIGISETNFGRMKVSECPKCFEKYYSHASDDDIYLFMSWVNNGKNKHFN